MSTNNDEKPKIEFSKILVSSIFLVYLTGFIVASVVVLTKYAEGIVSYLTFIGGPLVSVTGFYLWKSKAENIVKIKKNTGIDIPMNDGSNNNNGF